MNKTDLTPRSDLLEATADTLAILKEVRGGDDNIIGR
jgi:hypothetical protein